MNRQSVLGLALRFALVLAAPASGLAAYVASRVPPGQSTANPANFVGRTINVMDFGAQCDAATDSGQMTTGGHALIANNTQFSSADSGKPITVSGAGDWTLNGFVNSGSQVVFNVSYVAPDNSLHPSLIGAAGGAIINGDSAGAIIGATIATENWGTPDTGTFSLTTTGSWNTSISLNTILLTTAVAPIVGQNGQIVQIASGPNNGVFSPHTIAVQPGMVVNGNDFSNDVITAVSGTTITLTTGPPAGTGSEAVTISGQSSPYVIYLKTAAGATSSSDTFTIPGAPLTGFIGTVTIPTSTVPITQTPFGMNVSAKATVPGWVATKVTGIGLAGSGFRPGDLVTINDTVSTTLQVLSTNGGMLSGGNTNVYAQFPIVQNADSGATFNQSANSSGGGSGATFTVQYSPTGQFWYGTDDSTAINLALSGGFSTTPSTIGSTMSSSTIVVQATVMGSPSIVTGLVDGMSISGTGIPPNTWIVSFTQNIALNETTITLSQLASVGASVPVTITGPQTQGSDVWLPSNRACGVTSSINLPNGNTSLRGWDGTASGIVALAPMPTDANGYSYVVGLPPVYPSGGGMRDLYVNANKLSQFACGIEGGENQFYGNVQCRSAITSEWVCGYPGGHTNQISGTIFHHIRGATSFTSFGPVSLRPNENFLASEGCSAERVDDSNFAGGIVNILDGQSHFNAYLGNIEDSIEPFNSQYCVELTGQQLLANNRCDDASVAGIYITGGNAIVHDSVDTWNNAWPWGPTVYGQTYGVLIGPNVSGSLIDGVTAGAVSSNSDIVFQQGRPSASTIVVNSPGASLVVPGPGYGIPNPQGRLTLQSRTAVMSGSAVAQSTIYYDCFSGPNVPFFNGGSDQLDSINGCELSLPLSSTPGPGLELANDIFDVWWWHNGGSPVLCVATNGIGAGWKGDGGTLNQRGTGYTQLYPSSVSSRGYLTNKNAFRIMERWGSFCAGFNGSSIVDFVALAPNGTIPAGQLTYLGSFYTSAPGQTTFNPTPIPTGMGSLQAQIGLCNAYNQVPVLAAARDTNLPYSVHMASTWEVADTAHSGINNILVLDCLQTVAWNAQLSQPVIGNVTNNPKLSFALVPLNSVSGYTSGSACVPSSLTAPSTFTTQQAASIISVSDNVSSLPLLGATCAQAIEFAGATGTNYFNPTLQLQLPWQY